MNIVSQARVCVHKSVNVKKYQFTIRSYNYAYFCAIFQDHDTQLFYGSKYNASICVYTGN